MLGYTPAQTLFKSDRSDRQEGPDRTDEFTVVGVMGKRPSPLGGNPDEFAVIPSTTYDKLFAPAAVSAASSRDS